MFPPKMAPAGKDTILYFNIIFTTYRGDIRYLVETYVFVDSFKSIGI